MQHVLSPPHGKSNRLTTTLNTRHPSYYSSLIDILGSFPTGYGVKSEEDDLESVCGVSGVLMPPGEEK